MNFEVAFSKLREYGGYMSRLSMPNKLYIFDEQENVLKIKKIDSSEQIFHDEAMLCGSDIGANDWQVDWTGYWKDV